MLDPLIRAPVAISTVFCVLLSAAAAAAGPHYTVATDAQLQQLNVRACFDDGLPARLAAREERAAGLLQGARLESLNQRVELKPQGATLTLPDTGDPACVRYRVELSAIGKRQWRSGDWRARDVIVLDPGQVLE